MPYRHHRDDYCPAAYGRTGRENMPAIAGLSEEALAALPLAARHEYLAAYRRARRLTVMKALKEQDAAG